MVTHNWWHQALFLLEQDAPRRGAGAVRPAGVGRGQGVHARPDQCHFRLLARLELVAVDVGPALGRGGRPPGPAPGRPCIALPSPAIPLRPGPRRPAQRQHARCLTTSPPTPPTRDPHERTVWQASMCAHRPRPAGPCPGLVWATAAQKLGAVLPRLVEIGGSDAQRDLFHQIWLHALQRNGQWATVQNLLQPLCNAQPQIRFWQGRCGG